MSHVHYMACFTHLRIWITARQQWVDMPDTMAAHFQVHLTQTYCDICRPEKEAHHAPFQRNETPVNKHNL